MKKSIHHMSHTIPKIGFISLGCPKATVDSERILTQLRAEGYEITPHYHAAHLVIVNTCGFINDAVDESFDAIDEALTENGKVIVIGCLGTRSQLIREQFPEVLAIIGPNALAEVMNAVHQQLPAPHDPFLNQLPPGGVKLTPRHYAYLKIAEGCNQQCTFCIIPSLRGRLVSRSIGEILEEAQHLVEVGVRELLLVSQDTAAYGADSKYRLDFWQGRPLKTRITELARHLGELGVWIRLHYVYPYPHVDQLVNLMATGTVLPYLDVPLQHSSPKILQAMRRPANSENMLNRLVAWRKLCPNITLRSTFIVGFPGETEADFEQLLAFLQEAQLDRVGAFTYSAVAGAVANDLPNAVPEEVKEERLMRLMEIQAAISASKLQQRVGQTVMVLVDEVTPQAVYARSAGEAPEVDGMVVIETDVDLMPGDLVEVTITGAEEHDLFAKLVSNSLD
jgi:ribosomal protein S12 methylthiotransferase